MTNTVEGLDGLDETINDLVRNIGGAELERLTELAGTEILNEIALRAPVRTGRLKASIEAVITGKPHKASYSIQVADSMRDGIMHYAVFVEFGHIITRKARTRKSQRASDAGYDKVEKHPFMRPSFDIAAPRAVEKFADALNRVMVEKMRTSR